MGKLEKEASEEIRATRMQLAVLSSIKTVGLISLTLLAPNVAGLLARSMNRSHYSSTRRAATRLKNAGLIHFEEGYARLTPEGERFLSMHLDAPVRRAKWDGLWRVVIFDVPESKRTKRQRLRSMLIRLGFLKLQDSAWVYPYEAEDLVALIKAELHIGRDVLYMIVQKVENDGSIRKHFGLK